jgi:hypothetical protein
MVIKKIKLIAEKPIRKRKRKPTKGKMPREPRGPSLVDSKGFCMTENDKEVYTLEDEDGNIIEQNINGIEVGAGW